VRIEGESKAFTRSSEDGFWVRTSFCPNCGSTLFWEIERRPGAVSVAVGGFADPDFPEPDASLYGELAPPWLRIATVGPLREE
jgi:hypothetical protein